MIHTLDLHFQIPHAVAAFVVETSAGPVLVETGPYSTYPHLVQGLKALGYVPGDIRHVLLSHIHFDHAGAAWALAAAGATIYVHPAGYKHLLDPARLYGSAQRIYGDMMETLWGAMKPIPADQLVAPEHGETFYIGDTTFTAWYTPGHAVHHIAWQTDDTLFTGDVGGCKIMDGPVVPPCPPPDIDIEAWVSSLHLMRELAPARLYLTHFGEITTPEPHLTALETRLLDWAAWMKPWFEAGTPAQEIIPVFQQYVYAQLQASGVAADDLAAYEAANPAFMSVAGLLRYWQKKTAAE
ncbi:MAG: MBL fold metallo-hydrolase [Bacteroidia bacterium]|nr:MBL fold metallo-hydrolase [Bacteroidia bacterium]